MSDQEILNNAPKGATHYLINQYAFTEGYFKLTESCDVLVDGKNGWAAIDFDVTINGNHEVRSLADIKRIIGLEKERLINDLLVMSNARRLIKAKFITSNGRLYSELFGTGCGSGREGCRKLGLNPDGNKTSYHDSVEALKELTK